MEKAIAEYGRKAKEVRPSDFFVNGTRDQGVPPTIVCGVVASCG